MGGANGERDRCRGELRRDRQTKHYAGKQRVSLSALLDHPRREIDRRHDEHRHGRIDRGVVRVLDVYHRHRGEQRRDQTSATIADETGSQKENE